MVLSSELSLDASIGMKNPPKLEDKGSTARTLNCSVCSKIKGLSVLKQDYQKKTALQQMETSVRIPWPSSLGYRGNPMSFMCNT